ncbi:MAG: hypothetical protein HGA75_00625 [Thiobacillus sp.]|nr:hypothetical protein [Thiobacillus sp.]
MVVASTSALAVAPTSIEELTASVSFDNVGLAILAVTAAIIPVLLIWKGAKFVTRAIKGA